MTIAKQIARCLSGLALTLFASGQAFAADRVVVLSTSFVLEKKFQIMEEIAKAQGIAFTWLYADKAAPADIDRALDGAKLVIVDAPRREDEAQVDKAAAAKLASGRLPTAGIHVMNPPERLTSANLDDALARRLFDYYVAGTKANRERLFRFIAAFMAGGEPMTVEPPQPLPNGGIYHPRADPPVFASLPDYLAWHDGAFGPRGADTPVIGIEIASSYISDGQTRMLDEMIAAIEARGGVPLMFFRAPRRGGPPPGVESGRPSSRPSNRPQQSGTGFPNPKPLRATEVNEPLIMRDGKVLPHVMLVDTFIGGDPESRKAWHTAMNIPVIHVMNYRQGDRAAYLNDKAGIDSFSLPFTLTQSEYIGMQDPVILTANEGGELVSIPEQMDLLIGKAINLARLQMKPNPDKSVALLFWNHPPGEKNQGASNLNVPRSISYLVDELRKQGYAFDAVSEEAVIAAVADMLRPHYRMESGLADLMRTPYWDVLPLDDYKAWFSTLPQEVRARITQKWGEPDASRFVVTHDGRKGFVIPRMKLGHLVVMPQPPRGEMLNDEEQIKLFHDVKVPLTHHYLATYLWIRKSFAADAILHFGTHGSQEWTPGKERGLWAFDDPNLLVGNVPVVYPYIVDNIAESVHAKRRGRALIVSHQTPAFAPAGLSDDFVAVNEALREYQSLDQGPVKEANRRRIIDLVRKMKIDKDLKWNEARLEGDFDGLMRELEDYLEDLGTAQQPLGLHTLGKEAEPDHLASMIMQMLGQPLYEATGVTSAAKAFKGDYKALVTSPPFLFVKEKVMAQGAPQESDPVRQALIDKGRAFLTALRADWEVKGVEKGLSARWIEPSYGGDPIRNPDTLHTGRNIYGFDPSRIPTKAAYDAGRIEIERLIETYRKTYGAAPRKLAFSVWSSETMRHLGLLEGQILAAMGVRPVWDDGGRVTGMEVIPRAELGRPRIDPVIQVTGLYRDQFPNVMERINEAIVKVAALDEEASFNPLRANSERIEALLLSRGADRDKAHNFALTRIFGNESGDYGTGLPKAVLQSDQWDEKDGSLADGYLARMSYGFGPDSGQWSEKLRDGSGAEINAYAEHLRGTDAAILSRSSNLRGLLDTDHPFEFLGGLSLAIRSLDGKSPQLYISNLRDPQRAKLETAERFMANELRSVYQHPRWIGEMRKEGYAGTLQLLDTINNFWGWQAMDRNVVRDDQWQEFYESYVKDRYKLGLREWFDQSNPTALAQIAERMLEAVRKGYWKADEQTRKELVQLYAELAAKHDVVTDNKAFKAYVAELAQGYGLQVAPAAPQQVAMASPPSATASDTQTQQAETVQGRQMEEVKADNSPAPDLAWRSLLVLALAVAAGMVRQIVAIRRARSLEPYPMESP